MARGFQTYALLTFVTDIEKEVVLSMYEWEVFYLKDENETYYRTFICRDGLKLPVVAVGQREKGSIASATLAMKSINQFRPQYIFAAGIAAGILFKHKESQPEIGDVIIADSTWDLAKGKYTDNEQSDLSFGNVGYIPRPAMTYLNPDIRKIILKLCKSRDNPVRTHIGTYLTSGSVVANSYFMEKAILSSKLIAKALDMESFGITYACEMASPDKPTPIIAKGISDFADDKKSDDFQKQATENSIICIKYLLNNLPIDSRFHNSEKNGKKNHFELLPALGRFFRNFIERQDKNVESLEKMREFRKELDFLSEIKARLSAPAHFENRSVTLDAMRISEKAKEFSFYGFRPLDENRLAVNMASPIGKSIPSSILMSSAQNCFEVFIGSSSSLKEAVQKTNLSLSSSNLAHILYESWTCIIDYDNCTINYINAGHPAPFIIRNDGTVEDVSGGLDNPKLGLDDNVFTESVVHFNSGDSLILLSHGIFENRNSEGEAVGRKRLRKFLAQNADKPAREFGADLKRLLTSFSGEEDIESDWAVLRVDFKEHGSPKVFIGHFVDIINRRIYDGRMEVRDGIISSISECNEVQANAPYVLPGFIDSHVHIESSMLTPSEFAKVAARHGTIGVVSDPHEIANVLGVKGVDFMIDNASKTNLNFCFGAPSCVPSCGTDIERGGSMLSSKDVEGLLQRSDIGYLSEMMNFPGVLSDDSEVLAKIEAAEKAGKPVDGHAPGLVGKDRARYAKKGISTDHECTTYEEGFSCIENGMNVLIREGSAAKNYEALIPLLAIKPEMIMFCTDDSHPGDFMFGHVNNIVKRAINDGYDIWDVLRAASLNPQIHYKLNWGLLREGDPATFIATDSLGPSMRILATVLKGELPKSERLDGESEYPNVFEAQPISEEDIQKEYEGPVPVILASDGQLYTSFEYAMPDDKSYPWEDVQKIVVVNRYKKGLPPAIGYIRGYNIHDGAMASSIAHDCHNIVAIGSSDSQIVRVVNEVISMRGGMAALCGKNRMSSLALPIAGIMSPLENQEVIRLNRELLNTVAEAGCTMRSPFITMSFMCLPVIPQVKITDKGVFDIEKRDFI